MSNDIASGVEELTFDSRSHWGDQIAWSIANGWSLLCRSFE